MKDFLYPYQLEAVSKMKNGCILNGSVGSGKSRTAIYYYYTQQHGELDPKKGVLYGVSKPMVNPKDLYIITTARKRDTSEWEDELFPFLIFTDKEKSRYNHNVVIDSWNNIKKYETVKDAFFIFDEQRVVGYGAWTKSFLKIVKSNEWILLTATPGDTWSDYIPVFIANGFYRNKTDFNDQHVVYSKFVMYPKIEKYINCGKLIKFRNSILVEMKYKTKANLHHIDIDVRYDIEKYKDIGKTRWDPYKNEPITNASGLCFTWRRVVSEDRTRQYSLLTLLETHPKIIIFYNFNYELDILRELFKCLDSVKVAEYNGQTHDPIPKTDSWVYLVQYTAGAEGWNCIATDTMVFYSENYSYKIMQQSEGRINRLNTPFTDLFYYHFNSHSKIEMAIRRALTQKRDFNERKFVERS